MENKNKTVIISNRLPVKLERKNDELIVTPSEGGLATGLGSVYNDGNNVWIGWPGIIPQDESEEHFIREELSKRNLVPVFLTEEEIQGYYEGFSNEVLWPVFHYKPSYAVYNTDNWNMYQSVNKKFADVAFPLVEENDTVWIHDYQLMLLPSLIRTKNDSIAIGYFQHIPFPPDELFRGIPWAKELLNGVLGADLTAFHTFNDTQHFLEACRHLLGLPLKNNNLQVNGRSVYIEVYPMGIDFEKFNSLSKSPEVKKRAAEIKDFYQQKKIILSIDRLDYSKGILERIEAFEDFLNTYPEWRENVVLYMLVVPSRDTVEQYRKLRDDIDRRVGNINAVYGSHDWTPIVYFYNSFPVEELSALYVAADACLVTSLRDGMNLVCKEYIASKEEIPGVLVLSELAGAAKELIDAVQVNPNSLDQIRDAMYLALTMDDEEKKDRMEANLAIVKKFNIHHWVELFFARLKEVKQQQKQEFARKIGTATKEALCEIYHQSTNRLFFLDYDGTLIDFKNDANKATPTHELYKLLDTFQEDPRNQIVIISGRPQEALEKWFGHKDYILIGEHGAWKKYPGEIWRNETNLSTRWKVSVKEVMEKFANRTAGAVVEEKAYSLAWHYRKVQPGLGQLRALELIDSLRDLIPYHGLQLLSGDQVIEVKNAEVGKGKAALSVVNSIKPDFIFAIGDDTTDEDMFLELPHEAYTVKVGNKKSAARYYVENQKDAIALLEYLAYLCKENKKLSIA